MFCVVIEGHTDEHGSRECSLALGERCAAALRDLPIALGIDGSGIATISYGKKRPVEAGHTGQAWSRNRRAVLTIT
ncbi:MAG: OmpA family protein [Rhodospirillales bacterium]|nr:OmpA family protein [Rhodospirillales bacterium]